jgi:glycolate oxidase FAD binding subunit
MSEAMDAKVNTGLNASHLSGIERRAHTDERSEIADRQIVAEIHDAIARQEPLAIIGAGTWLRSSAKRTLSLADDRGIVEYNPNDLTLTVRAGTSLAEIDRTLEAHQQWLPLDPAGERNGTIGATVATCSYGPLAALFGTPRDLVLGLTVVTGDGTVIRPGGRVVKNVAGFDLTRLMIGAWGTLGVITQITLRVMARSQSTDAFEHMRRIMPEPYGYRKPVMTHPRLSVALKLRFDPHGILNPGFFEEVL